MKNLHYFLAFLLFLSSQSTFGQGIPKDINGLQLDTIRHLTMKNMNPRGLPFSHRKGWIYKQGHDASWANDSIEYKGWTRVIPAEIDTSYADDQGRIEGWFRFRFTVNDSIAQTPLYIIKSQHFAAEVYLDGELIKKYGQTGQTKDTFEEYVTDNPFYQLPVHLEVGKIHTLAIHYVDYTWHNNQHTKQDVFPLIPFINFGTNEYFDRHRDTRNEFENMTSGGVVFAILFLSLFLVYRRKIILLCVIYNLWGLLIVVMWKLAAMDSTIIYLSFSDLMIVQGIHSFLAIISPSMLVLILSYILFEKLKRQVILFLLGSVLLAVVLISSYSGIHSGMHLNYAMILTALVSTFLLLWLIWKNRLSLKGSKMYIVWGYVIGLFIHGIATITLTLRLVNSYAGYMQIFALSGLVSAVSFAIYIAQELNEYNQKVADNEMEKRKLIADQNVTLERQVAERTNDLNNSLEDLKSTQAQLIQSEKMASLGELTAGIAHEIQNPLNFVNNFSDVSGELIDEALEEIDNDPTEAKEILGDLKQNLEKISHHGGRASSIVKGMLDHSRTSSGERVPTDLNALCDEYLRLSYHGLRAKDKGFNADFETDFAKNIPSVKVVPQDIGRVVLNLITNAFQAVNKRRQENDEPSYKPKVICNTTANESHVIISVSDNGHGIPADIKEKIFQPFFTTKPTGQGTGLGLSLAYDIVKAHDGELSVESVEGNGTSFSIELPLT